MNAFLAVLVVLATGCSDQGSTPAVPAESPPPPDLSDRLPLTEGWAVRSSEGLLADGAALSTPGFGLEGAYAASVPGTVLAVLAANGVYPDPYFGMNLRSIPGTDYPIGENFSNLPMHADSPFRVSWWYRLEFEVPAEYRGREVFLHFEGINYRANIWVNGSEIADRRTAVGAYRHFRFEVTDAVSPGTTNCLAVEVFPPKVGDLAITWVDWNPMPADKNMGLWRDVYLSTSGPVSLRDPQVVTDLDLPSLEVAHLTLTVEVCNNRHEPVDGDLTGSIENVRVSQHLRLDPGESRTVTLSPEEVPQLNLRNPRLWWPTEVGPQHLYDLDLRFLVNGVISDRKSVRFGVREVTSELTEYGHRLFKVNGRNILIKGGGWAQDMLLRPSREREKQEIRYVKDLHLNTIRMEGQIVPDSMLDLCDENGMMVIAGWCCCAHWERWSRWDQEDYQVAPESLRSQLVHLRNHPSVIDWLNGSDFPPPPEVERAYLRVIEETRWPNPYQSSATEEPTPVTGPTGLKMTGPYEYEPPVYWYEDDRYGGAFGFNTETSPGAAVPPVASLRQMLPEDHLWPIDEVWNFHAGGGYFRDIHIFTRAVAARYGEPAGLEEYAKKAQALTYEAQRAMFEAYSRNKYRSTGVIQWMINDAWPKLFWHLYDYYLRPAGGYFGSKKACEPLHIQYSYDDRSVVVVNSFYEEFPGTKASARVLDFDCTERFSQEEVFDVAPDSSTRLFSIPEIGDLTRTYFLQLDLEDGTGAVVSTNFYWLSTQQDVLLWPVTFWFFTPTLIHGDFQALQDLPAVALEASPDLTMPEGTEEGSVSVSLRNPSAHLAFLVHLKLLKGMSGDEVLPILWEDNYLSLLPGEERRVSACFRTADLEGLAPVVEVGGWNVEPLRQPAFRE